MPPIPPKLSEDAQSLITSLTRRQTHLSTTLIPELRQCTGPLATQQQLAEDVREEVAYIARQVEVLDGMVDDQRGEKARHALSSIIEDFRVSISDLRTQTRSAILESKKAIDANSQSARNELLSFGSGQNHTYPPPSNSQNGKHDPNSLQSTSDALTTSLYRTLDLLQTSLSQSTETTQLLQASTASLLSTSNQHSTLSTTIESTKVIVRALEKADWMDRMLVGAAFLFFLCVVGLVVKERVFDKGVSILGWVFSPIGLVWRVFSWIVSMFLGGDEDWEIEAVKDAATDVKDITSSLLTTTLGASSLASVASSIVGTASILASPSKSLELELESSSDLPVASDDAPVPSPSAVVADHDEL